MATVATVAEVQPSHIHPSIHQGAHALGVDVAGPIVQTIFALHFMPITLLRYQRVTLPGMLERFSG